MKLADSEHGEISLRWITGVLVFFLPFSSQAASETLYRELIQHSFNQQSLCLGEKQWPVSIKTGSDRWVNAKMEALVDAGLLTSQVKAGRKVWELTPYGQVSFRRHHDFCYGAMRVRDIKAVSTDHSGVTNVTFTYYIHALPAWAKNHSVRVANTDLDNLVMGVDKVRYQALFSTERQKKIRLISEPEQLDLLY
ncbi:CpmK protein [Pantoea piersonii]|uniref:CpmK protein n=1 Tax=Pantoea piersonii TaxID=2364647 RepID=A0AAJ5QMP1_9GAMM|nr:CpmK protein [Pantoea piersonii]WBG93123.1 CpmK protein [Pantoea piersonii]